MPKYVLGESSARKVRALLAGKSAGGRRAAGGPGLAFDADFPPPFTVQWAASLATPESSEGAGDSTDGEWIIYIPASGVLTVNHTAVNITSALTAAGGDYPAGWYKLLDGEGEPILDRDDGGTLYLVVNVGATPSASFASQAGGASNPVNVVICTATVDDETGARTVNQFVRSALILAGGEDQDTKTTADEISISRKYQGQAVQLDSKIYSIKGFGTFHPDAEHHPTDVRGTFDPATTQDIDDAASSFAVLARVGNSDQPDANSLAYLKLRVKKNAEPFGIAIVNNVPTVVNCVFYFGGTLRTLSDYTAPASGTLYLAFTRSDPDAERGEPAVWSYQLTTTPAEPSTGASTVMNVKLYDFAAGEITMDYRSAFLTVPAPDFDLYYGKFEFKNLNLGNGGGTPTVIGKIVAAQDATITQKTLVAGSNITLTEANGTITISAAVSPVSAGPGIVVNSGEVAVNADGGTLEARSGSGNARKLQIKGAQNPAANLAAQWDLGQCLASASDAQVPACVVPVIRQVNGSPVVEYVNFGELNVQTGGHSGLVIQRGTDTGGRPCMFVNWDGRSDPYGTYNDIALRTVNIYAPDGTVALSVEVPASAAFAIPAVRGGNGISVTSENNGTVRRIDAAVSDVVGASGGGITATRNTTTGVVTLMLDDHNTTDYYTTTGAGFKVCTGMTYNPSTHKFEAQYLVFDVIAGRLCANPTSTSEEIFTAVEES